MLALLLALSATAAEAPAGSVPFSAELQLHELLSLARERHPEASLPAAVAGRAEAERAYAAHWFPGATQLSAFRITDRPLDDTGFIEDEVNLSVPLWLPGEKRTQGLLADASEGLSDSAAAAFAWRVSGEVRRALWELLQTQRDWELAVEEETQLAAVLEQAALLEEAGDIALGDRLAVTQELAAWRGERIEREAAQQDALRHYEALTGLRTLPGAHLETRTSLDLIDADHPALRLARDRMEQAAAALEALDQSNPNRPALQLFWRGTRPERSSPRLEALGVGVALPLGKGAARGPERAALNEDFARAEAAFLRLQRELELGLHEAEHVLHTVKRQLENSAGLVDAAEQKRALDRLALDLGDISVTEWLRRLQSYREIRRSHERLSLQRGAAIAAYNQAAGESL